MRGSIYYSSSIPVIEEKEIIVCGGGPAGISSAVAAARTEAGVVLVEKNGFLGGSATAGQVCSFAYGFHDKKRYIIGGIFREIRERLYKENALIKTERKGWEPFDPEAYKRLLDRMMREENVEVLFNAFVSDVVCKDKRIDAVIISTKAGLAAIKGKMIIDATGDGDVAVRSGVPIVMGRAEDGKCQPMTMMYLIGGVDIEKAGRCQVKGFWEDRHGRNYLNATGFKEYVKKAKASGDLPIPMEDIASIFSIPWMPGIVGINFGRIADKNPLNIADVSFAEAAGREQVEQGMAFLRKYVPGFENAFILSSAKNIGVRESRRIEGNYTLTEKDIINQKQFEDVIAQSCYMVDIHSPDGEGTFTYKLPEGSHYDIPLRCLMSEKADNLICTGRCISANHMALGSLRVQPVCMAVGQAAGVTAAICGGAFPVSEVDYGEVRKVLLEQGAILE